MPTSALIAAGVGAAGALGGSLLQSNAATNASNAQVALGQQALGVQQNLGQQGLQTLLDMFKQAQGIAAPLIGTGNSIISSTLPTLQSLLTPGPNQTATLSQIPGLQFAQDWGQKAVQNIGTTTGLGGNVLKAGADYATGVAQQGYGNIVGYLQNLLNSGVSAVQGPTDALITGAVNTGNSAFGNLNQFASTLGSTIGGIGNATASGILGSANALAGGLTGAAGTGSNALLSSALYSRLFPGTGAAAPGAGSGIYSSQPLTGVDAALNQTLFPGYGTA